MENDEFLRRDSVWSVERYVNSAAMNHLMAIELLDTADIDELPIEIQQTFDHSKR